MRFLLLLWGGVLLMLTGIMTVTRQSPATLSMITFSAPLDNRQALYHILPTGEQRMVMLSHAKYHLQTPHWSPDGQWIAYRLTTADGSGIYVAHPNGTQPRQVTPNPLAGAEWELVSWSHDGRNLLVIKMIPTGDQRWIYQLDPFNGNHQNLTQGAFLSVDPIYSPDGEWIVFASIQGDNPRYQIYRMRSDGTHTQALTNLSTINRTPVWSEDGESILFAATHDGDRIVYQMDVDGENLQIIAWNIHMQRLTQHMQNAPNGVWRIFSRLARLILTTGDGEVDLGHGMSPNWSPIIDLNFRAGWLVLLGVSMVFSIFIPKR